MLVKQVKSDPLLNQNILSHRERAFVFYRYKCQSLIHLDYLA